MIISTDDYHYQSWKKISNKHGFIFNRELNDNLSGVSRSESLKFILKYNNMNIDEKTFSSMLQEKNRIYRSLLSNLNRNSVFKGTIDLVEDLKRYEIKVGIGSSSKNARYILEKIELLDTFDAIIDGTNIANSKPDPEVFTKCADLLQIDYKECLVIEDAEAGIIAALKANMKVIGIGKRLSNIVKHYYNSLRELDYETIRIIFNLKEEIQ